MKKIVFFIAVMMLIGCASHQNYRIPTGSGQGDFLRDMDICANESGYKGGGGFIVGPAIIVLPVVGIAALVRANQQKKFQRCMTDKGYTCVEGCWKE
jgi:hypothetical protein